MPKPVSFPARWRARLLILLAVYLTFLGGTFVTDFDYLPRVAHHIIVIALAACWAISLLLRGKSFPSTPVDLPMLAILTCYTAATVFAVDRRVSVEALWQIGFHVLLFYMLVDAMRVWNPGVVIEPVFFASAVVILVGLIEVVSWYFGLSWLSMFQQGWFQIGGLRNPVPPVFYRISFTLSVSTFLSGYLALLFPVGLAWCISATKPDTRRGLVLWMVGALLVQLLSFSRGGLLSLAVSLPAFGILYIVGLPDRMERLKKALGEWRIQAASAGTLALIGLASFLWMRQSGLAGHSSGDNVRMDLWQSAWRVGLAHPLVGVGPYGFGRAMRYFRNPVITGDYFTSAHNIPLQVWAEAGSMGVVALIVLVLAVAWVGWRRWRNAVGVERVRLAGVLAALAGFSAHNQVDTLVSTPILLPCLALVAFLVVPTQRQPSRCWVSLLRVVPALMLGLVVLSAAGWGISDAAQYHFTQAVDMGRRGELTEALQSIRTAERLDPAMGYYRAQEAHYLGRMAANDETYLNDALAAHVKMLSLENTYALSRANYAMLLSQSGQMDQALHEMQAAQMLDPTEARYMLWGGVLAERQGDRQNALDQYQRALEMRPEWVGSSYWEETTVRSQARRLFLEAKGLQGWVPETLGILSSDCWPVTSPAGRSAIAEQPSWCQGEISLVVSGDAPAALDWLNRAIGSDTIQPWPYLLRAQAYLETGKLDLAEHDGRMAVFLGDSRAHYVLGRVAEARGDIDKASDEYLKSVPQVVQMQGWDVAVYGRRGDLALLRQLDAPGLSRRDFASALALIDLYESQGRDADAQFIRDAIRWLDPYLDDVSP